MFGLLAAADDGGSGWAVLAVIAALAWVALVIAGWWKTFEKAGEAGWKALIPIYNIIVLLRIVGQPVWMVVALLLPFVNVIVYIFVMIALAKSFGKGVGYALGLVFLAPIFAVMLGFGSARYQGPSAASPV